MLTRRALLKGLAALGIAAPLGQSLSTSTAQAAAARPLLAAYPPAVPDPGANLTSTQLAGQRVIYSYAGLTPPPALLQQIAAGQAAGVIFFADNIASDQQIAGVIQQLQQAQQSSPIAAPLLLLTDQEGGLVRRLPGEPALSEKQIGQSANPSQAAAQAGTGAAQNLAGVGMNANLAPVLDVYRQPGDFTDQYQRSYSSDPQIVAACGKAFISAQQQAGVAATAKHFPGLGAASASQNTDQVPVTLTQSLATLRAVDEAPYIDAIAAGVDLIMCSWAVYPALDLSYPAGLSQTIVQGELRGRLGFLGVTVTDALEAGALNAFGDTAQRAVLAASAGMDLLLCSARDVGQGQAAVAALASALDSGRLDANDFTVAVQRVSNLRSGHPRGRYFGETGHWLRSGFLAYWNQFGGLPVFGYPITEEFTDAQTNRVTQYFERARFEWHPGEWPARFDVMLGLLGDELARRQGLLNTTPFQPVVAANDANCTFYSATGHRLCFGFRDFWNSHGGLAIYGYPISEEYTDPATGFTVQYFERQRLEYHPENPPAWQVEGGLLGDELAPKGG